MIQATEEIAALTDLAHEGDRFLREYRGLCLHLREIEAEEDEHGDLIGTDLGIDEFPSPETLEFLIGRAMHAIRKANTREDQA
jgi:hypothetical protein